MRNHVFGKIFTFVAILMLGVIVGKSDVWAANFAVNADGSVTVHFEASELTDITPITPGASFNANACLIHVDKGAANGEIWYSLSGNDCTFPASDIYGFLNGTDFAPIEHPASYTMKVYAVDSSNPDVRGERALEDTLVLSKIVVTGDANGTYTVTDNHGNTNATTGYGIASTLYSSGENVTLNATPNSGYSFNKWTVSGAASTSGDTANPCTVTFGPANISASGASAMGYVPISSITISPTTVALGSSPIITAAITPSNATNQTVTWSVDDVTAAEINSTTGQLTPKKAGTVKVTATVVNGASETTPFVKDENITITAVNVTDITLTNASPSLTPGASVTLDAQVVPTDATYKTIVWSFSPSNTVDTSKFTLSGNKVTAHSDAPTSGSLIMRATIDKGLDGTNAFTKDFTIALKSLNPVTKFTIPGTINITKGFKIPLTGDYAITIEPTDATNQKITWTVAGGDPSVITMTGDGKTNSAVTANKKGSTTLKGTIANATSTGDLDSNSGTPSTVIVYDAPSASYDSSTGVLKVVLDSKVYTGTDKSVNLTNVTGAYLVFKCNGSEVAALDCKDRGQNFTLSADDLVAAKNGSGVTLADQLKNNKYEGDLEVVVYPVGTSESGVSNTRNTATSATAKIHSYLVKVFGENISGAFYYGIAQQKLNIAATPLTGCTFSKWKDNSTAGQVRSITVSSDASRNNYEAIATSTNKATTNTPTSTAGNRNSSSGAGYDRVPKTGEDNTVAILFVLLGVCALGAVLAVTLRRVPKKNSDNK